MNTNMVTTMPSTNQNTIDEIKILFKTKYIYKTNKITLKRNYIFIMEQNKLYFSIIDNNYDLNKIIEFELTPFEFDETEIFDQMEIIKVHKDDKISYIIFLLSKSGLVVIPMDYCRTTLKNLILNGGFNKANCFKLFYKLEYIQDPLNHYHMIINYQNPEKTNVYLLNNNKLITIELNLPNLKYFINNELFKLNLKTQEENYEIEIEEKIELDNNKIAFLNIAKKIISFNNQHYVTKKLKILGYITKIKYLDGNFAIYDKLYKSLSIYYFNGEFLDKVENYKDVDLIFFFTFNKIFSIFFCMNNTFNKISFNKKLYWYSQYFNTSIKNLKNNNFTFPYLKRYIHGIKQKYINGIFKQNDKEIIQIGNKSDYKKNNKNDENINIKYCEFCRKQIIIESEEEIKKEENEISYYKCPNNNCQTIYCSQMHRDFDYKSFHFFHCKLNQFFLNYKFSSQVNFYNDLILLINDILKYIFIQVKYFDDYLHFLPFIKMLIFILKSFNMKTLSDLVLEYSQKIEISTEDLTSLLFYQEVIFYYYNLIILSLNFGLKCNLLSSVMKELDFLSEDEEQIFSKINLIENISFKKNVHFCQENIDFSKNKNYFFVNENYLMTSKYLKQNDILFSHIIHLYANYLHLIDKLCKENQLNLIYLNPFAIKLLTQLMSFFQERYMDYPDEIYAHFLTLISPYFILNRKITFVNNLLNKALQMLDKIENNNSLFKVEILHNLGLVQYSQRMFLEGIHNIEKGYELILYKDYSYLLRIKFIERLALAYLNIGELHKSFVL